MVRPIVLIAAAITTATVFTMMDSAAAVPVVTLFGAPLPFAKTGRFIVVPQHAQSAYDDKGEGVAKRFHYFLPGVPSNFFSRSVQQSV